MSAQAGLDPRQLYVGRTLPFVRANAFAPFIDFLGTIGSPVERRLQQARLSLSLLEDGEALVPAMSAYRFLEVVARHEQLGDLGAVVGQRSSAFELGAYGAALQGATTVYEYLQLGTRLLSGHSSGTSIWLKAERTALRVNQHLTGTPGEGRCIGDLFTLVVTINMLRRFIGPDWHPAEVRLMAGTEKMIQGQEVFGDALLLTGQRHTSFTMPFETLQRPIPGTGAMSAGRYAGTSTAQWAMPSDFKGSVEQLIFSLMHDECPSIQFAAEVACLSPRTLQRRLAAAGTSFSALVSAGRLRAAKRWLAGSTMSVTEIAARLGYHEATNFARAFRRQTGVSPSAYRRMYTRD
jgi:AraC-like DNA-binding protein